MYTVNILHPTTLMGPASCCTCLCCLLHRTGGCQASTTNKETGHDECNLADQCKWDSHCWPKPRVQERQVQGAPIQHGDCRATCSTAQHSPWTYVSVLGLSISPWVSESSQCKSYMYHKPSQHTQAYFTYGRMCHSFRTWTTTLWHLGYSISRLSLKSDVLQMCFSFAHCYNIITTMFCPT